MEQPLDELESALSEEQFLMEDLDRMLLRQRAGVAADDPEVIESTAQAISRALLTLDEARRRRAALITLVIGNPGVALEDLQGHLAIPLPAGFTEVRERVRRAGEAIAGDVAINQDVLRRALEAEEAFRQRLFSDAIPPIPGQPQ
ncbi:MAG: hypothetical protein ACJ8DC_07140 [Gemmatimonadales bacterium]